MFTLYDLIKASVLFINALAIINEQRFLAKYGWDRPAADAPPTLKNRFITLLYGVRLLMQMPLIWVNLLLIIIELLIG